MKNLLTFALCATLLFFAGGPARGQSAANDAEATRLKIEIQRREAIERNAAILPSDKDVNRVNLAKARAALRSLLQSRVAAKRELKATLGDSISAAESQNIERDLEALEADLRRLEQTAAAEPSPAQPSAAEPSAATTASEQPPAASDEPAVTASEQPSPLAAPANATTPVSSTSLDNAAAPVAVNPGQPAPLVGGGAGSSSFTVANDKTSALPLRDCQEVARLNQQSLALTSQLEKFFCARVEVLERNKALNSPLARLELRRDFFFFMIALLAREGRAQYVLEAEEERVDKQVGSDASSAGSTSLVSKGSVPSILGFAVDTGALLQSSSGSTLTFRGNLAGLAKAVAGKGFISGYDEDSSATRFLRKISFALAYDPSRGTEPGVFTGRKQQLSNYSVRFDIYNKRDPREPRFKSDWDSFLARESNNLVAQVQASLVSMTNINQNPPPAIPAWNDPGLQAWFVLADSAIRSAARGDVERVFREQLDKIPTDFSEATTAELRSFDTRFRPWLEQREAILAKVARAPIVTFEYLNDRPLDAPTISQFKFIAETGLMRRLDLTFNGSLALFDSTPATTTGSRIRDFQFALQLDAQMGEMGMGFGKPVLSFAGRYERLKSDALAAGLAVPDTRGDIGVGQIKLTIPIKNSGIKIPLSFSFANRSELVKEREVRGNFGFTFDLDTLFAKFKPFQLK
jgi:hypothetical protein